MTLFAQGHRGELIKRKARLQPDAFVQIVDIAGGNAKPLQRAAKGDAARQWLRRHHAADTVESFGAARHGEHGGVAAHAPAEKHDGHVARVRTAANIIQRTDNIAGFIGAVVKTPPLAALLWPKLRRS